jgi:hypothetical protein
MIKAGDLVSLHYLSPLTVKDAVDALVFVVEVGEHKCKVLSLNNLIAKRKARVKEVFLCHLHKLRREECYDTCYLSNNIKGVTSSTNWLFKK